MNWRFGVGGVPRFFFKRFILFLVNLTAGNPAYAPLNEFRRRLLRMIGVKFGRGSQISESLHVYDGRRVTFGVGTRLGAFCRVFDFSPIKVGDNLLASHGLTLISGTHSVETLEDRNGPITIGNNVWIGVNVTIVGPVTIGDGSVIGAGSIVLKDIPSNVVAAGAPARTIRSIERESGLSSGSLTGADSQ